MNPNIALEAWLERLLTITLQAALLVPLILLVQWLLRDHLSARWRHAFWWLLVLRLLLPVSFTTPVSIFNLTQFDRELVPPIVAPAKPEQPTAVASADQTTTLLANDTSARTETAIVHASTTVEQIGSIPRTVAVDPIKTGNRVATTESSGKNQFLLTAGGVWLAGVVVLLSIVAFQTGQFSRRLRHARKCHPAGLVELLEEARHRMEVRQPVELLETSAVNSPVLYGFFKLKILLPLGFAGRFSREELGYVLFHELAHVKRCDLWSNWILTLLQVMHWFNPLVWLAFARMRSDRELACDELALQQAEVDSAPAYGRTIIKLLEGFSRPAAMSGLVGILEDKQQMKRRIQMIAKFKNPGRWSAIAVVAIAGLGLVTLTDGQSPVGPIAKETVEEFTTIDLTPYYEKGSRSDFDNSDSGWENFPKGDQKFLGIPFSSRGFILLDGKAIARAKSFELNKVIRDIPVGRGFQQLHMLQASAFRTKVGNVIANIRINYADGSWLLLPIAYGKQNGDWSRSVLEPPLGLDENTRIAWTDGPPSNRVSQHSTRIFLTSFDNPHPQKTVSTVSLESTGDEASAIIVGITVGRALTDAELAAQPVIQEPTEPRDATIAIRLVQGESHARVRGMRLKVSGVFQRVSVELDDAAITGEDGVALVSYSSKMSRLTIAPVTTTHASVTARWEVTSGQQIPPEYTLKLRPSVPIAGVVVDSDGHPVNGATVNFYAPNLGGVANAGPEVYASSGSAVTDVAGRWQITGFSSDADSFSISITHPDFPQLGFVTDSAPSTDGGERIPMDDLRSGLTRFVMKRGIGIAGLVLDSSSRPIVGATVNSGDTRYSADRKKYTTDAAGRFQLSGLSSGDTTITVQAAGFAPVSKRFTIEENAEPVTIQLGPGHVYTGRITDPEGNPIQAARVAVEQWHGLRTLDAATATDAEGRYRLESLPDSGIELYVGRVGYLQLRNVSPSAAATENDYVLKPTVKIAGRVTDAETGRPIAAFTVIPGEVYAGMGRPYWRDYEVVRGMDGSFTFEITESRNSYVLKIESAGYLPAITENVGPDEGPKELQVSLKKGFGPRGTVVFANGVTAPGVSVGFATKSAPVAISASGLNTRNSGNAPTTVTDATGRFELPAQVDGLALVAFGLEGFGEARYVDGTTDYRIELTPMGAISGVLKATGFDVADQGITLTGALPGSDDAIRFDNFRTTTDTQGRFTLTGVPPGDRKIVWLLKTTERSWAHHLPTEVVVKPGETTEVAMTQTGRMVTGRALLSDRTVPVKWQYGSIGTKPPPQPRPFKSREEAEEWGNSPEMKEYQKRARHYQLIFQDDGKFKSIPAEPGAYQLSLSAVDPESVDQNGFGGKSLGHLTRDIIVPDGTDPLDLGDIEVFYFTPLKVGDPAPDFAAVDAAGQPFSLAKFRGRKVMMVFGGVEHYKEIPDERAAMVEETLTIMRDAMQSDRASFVALISEKDFSSAVETVTSLDLPFVLGVVDNQAMEQLQRQYYSAGVKIVGTDGNISHSLQFTSPEQMTSQLKIIFSQ